MAMRYRKLGQWGIKVSEISMGAWTTYGDAVKDEEKVREIVRIAYEGGINFFDNADAYARGQGEELMSRALSEFPRHTLVMSTKLFWPMSDDINDRGLSRKHILESIGKSLRRMGTDYVDLYFCHRHDPEVGVEELVPTMSSLVDRGMVLYWGTSEWPATRIVEAVNFARANRLHPPAVEQPQYSMLYRDRVEKEILPETEKAGMGMVVWSPLAQGMLTGRYDKGAPKGSRFERLPQFASRYMTEENAKRVKALKKIADGLDMTRSQLALAWTLRQKGVSSAITGASKPEQIRESLGAGGVDLPQDALDKIEKVLSPA